MSVTFNGNFSRVERAIKQALNSTTATIARDSNRYVKKDTGATESSMWSASDFPRGLIIWDTEYAAYAYYLNGALKGKNPLAEMRWFDVAKANHLSEWIQVAQRAVEREL